jgi:hypothetical protein
MRGCRALIAVLVFAAALPGCVGPCSAPVLLMPVAWLMNPPATTRSSSAKVVDPADFPADVAIHSSTTAIDIRTTDRAPQP